MCLLWWCIYCWSAVGRAMLQRQAGEEQTWWFFLAGRWKEPKAWAAPNTLGFPPFAGQTRCACPVGLISTFPYPDGSKRQQSHCESAHCLHSNFPMDANCYIPHYAGNIGVVGACRPLALFVWAYKSSWLPLEGPATFQSLGVGRCERRFICLQKL